MIGPSDYFAPGEWSFHCDECFSKRKSSEARFRWDGAIVCPECWEPRHPQDFVRGVKDNQAPAWTRPGDSGGNFLFIEDRSDVTTFTRDVDDESAIAGGVFKLGKIDPSTLKGRQED